MITRREQLHELREAGVHRVMCQQLVHEDLEAVALLGERLAPLVAYAGGRSTRRGLGTFWVPQVSFVPHP